MFHVDMYAKVVFAKNPTDTSATWSAKLKATLGNTLPLIFVEVLRPKPVRVYKMWPLYCLNKKEAAALVLAHISLDKWNSQ